MYLFLAGQEAWHELFLEHEVPYALGTFYYLRKKRNRAAIVGDLKRAKQKKPGYYRFFLDSGAFTFFTESNKQDKSMNPDVYFQEYLEFLKEHHHIFDIVAELDLTMVPYKQVLEWRRKLIEVVGPKLLTCWHLAWGDQVWQEMCADKRHKWIATSSEVIAGKSLGLTTRYIAEAHRNGKLIHGFGQTRIQTDLKFMKFDSIDSTSWLRGDKFGATFIFKGGKMIVLNTGMDKAQKYRERKLHSRYFKNIGVDVAKLLSDDVKEVRKSSVIAWRKLR